MCPLDTLVNLSQVGVTAFSGGDEQVKTMNAPLDPTGPHPRRQELVATRVTQAEKAYVKALAKAEGCTITALVYDMVMPVVKERLSQNLGGMEPS